MVANASFFAEDLLDTIYGAIVSELPATVTAVKTRRDAMDVAAGRTPLAMPAPKTFIWGYDPQLLERKLGEYPLFVVIGSSRDAGTSAAQWGHTGRTSYDPRVEVWMGHLDRETTVRLTMRYTEAMLKVLHAHRLWQLQDENGSPMGGDMQEYEFAIEFGDPIGIRNAVASSGNTGPSFFVCGASLPLRVGI